jgi:transcriptional regulator with XRE-family HTH domain
MTTHQQTATKPVAILIGRNIREIRQVKDVTAKELAHAVGSSQSQLSGWERGKELIRLDRLIAVAKYLDVNVCHFFEE